MLGLENVGCEVHLAVSSCGAGLRGYGGRGILDADLLQRVVRRRG